VEIRITDEGPGIPDASLRRVFDLFYRDPDSARAVAGSGIGLFVCRSLVEAMGGRMWAVRPAAGGSEFGFTLRVIEADEADREEPTDRPSVLPVRPYPDRADPESVSRKPAASG
jgi:signal transduction histidine kinase